MGPKEAGLEVQKNCLLNRAGSSNGDRSAGEFGHKETRPKPDLLPFLREREGTMNDTYSDCKVE